MLLVATRAGAQEALTPDEQQAVDRADRYFGTQFDDRAAEGYDADLRPAVQALLREMRAAIPVLARRWTIELRSSGVAPLLRAAALQNRFVAELALWRAEPLSPEDDRRWLAAARQPRSCLAARLPPAVQPLRYLQAVPAAERAAALQDEHARLARLGGKHDPALRAPLRDWVEESRVAVQTVKALGVDKAPPLPPVLADLWLGETFVPPGDRAERCSAALWWMKLQTAPAAEQLAILRFALAPQAADYFATNDRAEHNRIVTAGTTYLAQFFTVSGHVELQVEVGADGRPSKATIARRTIEVPGLGAATPPLAFETLLDAPAFAEFRRKLPRSPAGAQPANSPSPTRFSYDFKAQ